MLDHDGSKPYERIKGFSYKIAIQQANYDHDDTALTSQLELEDEEVLPSWEFAPSLASQSSGGGCHGVWMEDARGSCMGRGSSP